MQAYAGDGLVVVGGECAVSVKTISITRGCNKLFASANWVNHEKSEYKIYIKSSEWMVASLHDGSRFWVVASEKASRLCSSVASVAYYPKVKY